MFAQFRPALVMLIIMTAITGVLYPLVVTQISQTVMPHQANGSLIRQGDKLVGSELIGQAFSGSGPNPSYGLTFWLNRQAPGAREIDIEKELDLKWQRARWTGICVCKAAPPDMVVALGSNYERLFIIPSLNAVIVRQGWSARFSDAYFLRLVLGR